MFAEPWHAQAFALAVTLHAQGVFTWREWADTLARCIAEAHAGGDPDDGSTYGQRWLAALGGLVAAEGLGSASELTRPGQARPVARDATGARRRPRAAESRRLQEAIELAAPPLTHHEILSLVEPFARRGRHVDLAASQRQERRLVFKPAAGEADRAADAPREVLQLDCLEGGTYRLTRTLGHAQGATATLVAQGRDLATLVADVEAVPATRHFVAGPGFLVARSYTVERARGDGPASLDLVQGSVHVDGLVLSLRVSAVRRVAGDLSLEPTSAAKPALPEDLLAVLGWNWARLVPVRQGWTSKLRLRGRAAERTPRAEAALDQAAAHLARTLAEPPARYHERMRRERWGVFFRRGIPTFTAVALVVIAALLPQFLPDLPMPVWVAMYHVPTVIVAISFMLQELPRFEIPPWPKPLQAPQWRAGSPAVVATGAAAGG